MAKIFGWFGVADFREDRVLYRQLSPPRAGWRTRLVWSVRRRLDMIRIWGFWHLPISDRQRARRLSWWWGRTESFITRGWVCSWNGWRGAVHDDEIKGYWWAYPRDRSARVLYTLHRPAPGYHQVVRQVVRTVVEEFDLAAPHGIVVRGADSAWGRYARGQVFDVVLPPLADEHRITFQKIGASEITFTDLQRRKREARVRLLCVLDDVIMGV